MVFESLVADQLNRFLGDYVENVDPSQVQVGIFEGDVVLQDLVLKQSALDSLQLPVKIAYGCLGKVVLKISLFSLHSTPVIVNITKLFLLVVPNVEEAEYNAAEEENKKQQVKQAALQRLEAEKDKDKAQQSKTLIEKLAPQIIKNARWNIEDIHIRYEDMVTCPQRPFSAGVTLRSLLVYTADFNGEPHVVPEDLPAFCKVLVMECLAVYWNCKSRAFSDSGGDQESMRTEFQYGICTKYRAPCGFRYLLGPINTSAKLRINPTSEQDGSDFSIMKMLLDFALEKISVCVSKDQYQDMVELLEYLDRRKRATYYRKYRPNLSSYHGHYKQWWKFACTCVLEEEVRRRHRNWSWYHMRAHRRLCRDYAEVYRAKLFEGSQLPSQLQLLLARCERDLDLTNIVIVRQKVEAEKNLAALAAKWQSSWFSWLLRWFGVEKDEPVASAENLTEETRLKRVMDSLESAAPPLCPTEVAELSAQLTLRSFQVEVRGGGSAGPRVALSDLEVSSVSLKKRPAAPASRFRR